MNRFIPLRSDVFKRFVMRLKDKLGLKHASTLETVAKACGFKGFHEVSAIHREGAPRPVPAALQCAGDLGFEVWLAQLGEAVGSDVLSEKGTAELRRWYCRVFESRVSEACLPAVRESTPSEQRPSRI